MSESETEEKKRKFRKGDLVFHVVDILDWIEKSKEAHLQKTIVLGNDPYEGDYYDVYEFYDEFNKSEGEANYCETSLVLVTHFLEVKEDFEEVIKLIKQGYPLSKKRYEHLKTCWGKKQDDRDRRKI